ncbi:MAG: hypothetical protein R3315_04830 [Woeseiaceae bacterium]|nr:hypothetical protein [Woeseiaceae bacterium]
MQTEADDLVVEIRGQNVVHPVAVFESQRYFGIAEHIEQEAAAAGVGFTLLRAADLRIDLHVADTGKQVRRHAIGAAEEQLQVGATEQVGLFAGTVEARTAGVKLEVPRLAQRVADADLAAGDFVVDLPADVVVDVRRHAAQVPLSVVGFREGVTGRAGSKKDQTGTELRAASRYQVIHQSRSPKRRMRAGGRNIT